MKLLRFGAPGREKPGLLDARGTIRDLAAVVGDLAGPALLPESLARLSALNADDLPAVEGSPRLGPCVGQIGAFGSAGSG